MEIEVGDEITCTLCGSMLSVPPIIDVEDIGMVCGRCQDSIYVKKTNPTIERQSLYEKIAASKRFPCKYHLHGCVEKPSWDDVVDHEKSCAFGKIACCYRSKDIGAICLWIGNLEHFISHFKEIHDDYFVGEPKVVLKEILAKKYCMFSTEYLEIFIIFRFIFDEETDSVYFMAVTDRNEKAESIQYELKMSDNGRKCLSFSEYSVFKCLYIVADLKQFGYKIKMSDIRNFPEFHYIYINIESRKLENILGLSSVSTVPLTCFICKTSILPPSYFYFDKKYYRHTQICCKCGPRSHHDFSGNHQTYNFMSLHTKFTCINASEGCKSISSYSDVKTHQNICPFNIIRCFLCDWQGRGNALHTHIDEKHEISDIHESYDLRTSRRLLFKFDGQFLSCSVGMRKNNDYEFTVKNEQPAKHGYKYEIEIFSEELISTKLLFQHIADNKLRKIFVPLDLLEQLFPIIPHLIFKFNVSKLGIDK
ncbi:hypothetical protein WA026_021693 [Henosepilachna vigintioctopunctata]|uniref:SIAH-type domain-containing protein n=1 Tax=Henosepilachna vigintioctopunctata TaxID=420089 RepID=A0AAW1UET8_9CUCU